MSETDERTILVTGATGLAGSAVIREFVRNAYPVRALARHRDKARAFDALPHVEVDGGDMAHPESLDDALSGVDRVLLISSPTSRWWSVRSGSSTPRGRRASDTS